MKTAFLASSLFAVAACGPKGSSGEPKDPCADNKAAPSGPAYAALFTQGASWDLEVITVDSEYDSESESGEQATTSDPVTVVCNSSDYTEAEGITSIEITCGEAWPSLGGDPLTGAWAMSDKGVWRIEAFPGDGVAPELLDEYMLIAAAPVAGTSRFGGEDDPEVEGIAETTLELKGDTWCRSEMAAMGDESWVSMCVGPDGPTEGNWGWAGGSVHEAKFTRAR